MVRKIKILGITGLAGAGKTVVREILSKELGWSAIRLGDITDEILKERGLENNEENNRRVREEIRERFGRAGYLILSLDKIKRAIKEKGGVIIDGIYSYEEVEELMKYFSREEIKIISVLADRDIREERIGKRAERALSKEELARRDIHEVIALNKGTTIALADFFICNNGDKEKLKGVVRAILDRL